MPEPIIRSPHLPAAEHRWNALLQQQRLSTMMAVKRSLLASLLIVMAQQGVAFPCEQLLSTLQPVPPWRPAVSLLAPLHKHPHSTQGMAYPCDADTRQTMCLPVLARRRKARRKHRRAAPCTASNTGRCGGRKSWHPQPNSQEPTLTIFQAFEWSDLTVPMLPARPERTLCSIPAA